MRRTATLAALAAAAISAPVRSQTEVPVLPTRAAVQAMGAGRVTDPRIPGLAIGRLAEDGRLAIGFGYLREHAGPQVTPETLFEIGSITKAFTGVLLAEMALRGEVALDDPVSRHLPPGMVVPEKDGVAITLRHLSSHTSGLPRLPGNLAPANNEDPYADYSPAQLTAFLANHELRRAPGVQYEYSNLGAGLLGWALAHSAGRDYEALIRERVLAPLGMNETVILVPDGLGGRFATGHNGMGEPTSPWAIPTLAGAGALRSTVNDMLRFAAAARDTTSGPLGPAMALSQREVFRVDSTMAVGLGWHHMTRKGRTYVWHNGGTGGFRSMLAVDHAANRASVALGNSTVSNDAVAIALLDSTVTLPALPPMKVTVEVDSASAARFIGEYQLTPQFIISIKPRTGGKLQLQATGQGALRLYPSSPVDFFVTEVEASVTFQLDTNGKVASLVLHQNGQDLPAGRITP